MAHSTYSIANQLGSTGNGLNVIYNQVANSRWLSLPSSAAMIGQLDQGPDLVLASIPSITSVEQLKGKPIITVGTPQRFSALVNAALPNGTAGKALPEKESLSILARVSNVVAPATSSAFANRESSRATNPSRPLNSIPCSIQALAKQLGVSQAVATQEYASTISPASGEISPLFNELILLSRAICWLQSSISFTFTAVLAPGTGRVLIKNAAVAKYKRHHLNGNCTTPCQR
ncbi:hypothetical protein ACQKWADRAFT_320544 [Trichoderma austrokoningii]